MNPLAPGADGGRQTLVDTNHTQERQNVSTATWRIVLLASLGGTLEFYDFVIFGVFAKDIADAIFPNPTPLISLIVSFAAFAAGYLAQGFCVGGELPGALTYVVETAPRHAPFVCGVVFSCVTMGVAAASGVSLALRTWLPSAVVATLGWRIAFLLGGLGGLLSFALRRSLEESPEFTRMKELASTQPFREVLRTHLRPVALGISILAATAGFNGLFFAHIAAYASSVLGYSPRQAVVSQTIGVVAHALGILAVGRLADRVHPRVLLRVGSLALVALAFPFYSALAGRSLNPTLLMMLAGLCASLVNGAFAVVLTDLFPTRVRFSGVALGFNVAFTIFSGTAPLVATSLIRSTGLSTAPAFVMVACGLFTFVGSLGLSRGGGYVLERAGRGAVGAQRAG